MSQKEDSPACEADSCPDERGMFWGSGAQLTASPGYQIVMPETAIPCSALEPDLKDVASSTVKNTICSETLSIVCSGSCDTGTSTSFAKKKLLPSHINIATTHYVNIKIYLMPAVIFPLANFQCRICLIN